MTSFSDLSDLAELGPNHDTASMIFETVDVARVARALERKPTRLVKALFGLNPRGLAHLLRKLWLVGEGRAVELAVARKQAVEFEGRWRDLKAEVKTITYRLDRILDRFGKREGVIVLTEPDFMMLEDEYTCTGKTFASSRERWAYTFRNHRVYSAMSDISGPLIMTPEVFEVFKLGIGKAIGLRER